MAVKLLHQPAHWSYSAWSVWKSCPYKYGKQYREGIKQGTSYALERGISIHAKSEQYLKGRIPNVPKELAVFTEQYKLLKEQKPVVEQFWGVTMNWEKAPREKMWCLMKMDAAVPPSKASPVLVTVDLKTGREYDSHADQASLYSAVGYALYPKIDLATAEFWYSDYNCISTFEYSRKLLTKLTRYWKAQGRNLMLESKFKKTPSEDACKYCHVRSDKGGDCKAWKKL